MFKKGQLLRSMLSGNIYLVADVSDWHHTVIVLRSWRPFDTSRVRKLASVEGLELIGNNYKPKR